MKSESSRNDIDLCIHASPGYITVRGVAQANPTPALARLLHIFQLNKADQLTPEGIVFSEENPHLPNTYSSDAHAACACGIGLRQNPSND